MQLIFAILFLAWCLYLTSRVKYFIHMLQLNSYMPGRYWSWALKSGVKLWGIKQVIPIILLIVIMVLPNKSILNYLAAFAYVLIFLFRSRKPAKKPLVVTHRVKRLIATIAVLILIFGVFLSFYNSSEWLMALVAVDLLLPFLILVPHLINMPIEKAINKWYYNDALKKIRSMPNLIVIGVTGSFGKTSTKFILNRLIGTKYNVLMTPESYNTTMGVVRTIREKLNATHDVFIVEMGAKNVGDIKEICTLVKPSYGVISSIGEQHLETFKTIENIINTKFELADAVKNKIFLNFDNKYIKNRATKNTVSYGTSGKFDYYAGDIEVTTEGSDFKVYTKQGESQSFHTRMLGRLNVTNIVAAIAVANSLDIDLSDLTIAVNQLEPVPHRLALIKGERYTIIDDAFNSNPQGAEVALETLKGFTCNRVLVTPGMVELGEKQNELNKTFGKQAANSCDYIILVGEKQTLPIKEGVMEACFSQEKIYVAKNLEDALLKVNEYSKGETVVLLENDLPDNFL